MLRIVTLVGLLRVLVMKFAAKKSPFAGGFNTIDKAFLRICSVVAQAIATPLQYMDSQALVNQFANSDPDSSRYLLLIASFDSG